MQYECQPSLSVVYYSILQYIAATSRQYGYQPGVPVVYYSILQNITATSRGYLTVIQCYKGIRASAEPVGSTIVYYNTSRLPMHGRTGRKKLGGRKEICPTFSDCARPVPKKLFAQEINFGDLPPPPIAKKISVSVPF